MVVRRCASRWVVGLCFVLAVGCEESTLDLLGRDTGLVEARDASASDVEIPVDAAAHRSDADANEVGAWDVGQAGPPDTDARDADRPDDVVDARPGDASGEDVTPHDALPPDAMPGVTDASSPDGSGPVDAAEPEVDAGTTADPSCAGGTRTGFREVSVFPDVAACGPRLSYAAAQAVAAISCGVDFHPCTYDDPRLASLVGTPAPFDTVAWLPYEASVCGSADAVFTNAACAGPVAQSAYLFGAGGCENSGACGQGYRLVLWTASWGWSVRLGGDPRCLPNLNHACAYGGGAIAPLLASVACCRN